MTEGVKKLHRSNDQRMIGGVCGGLGEYFNTDPTIVRLLFVAFALVAGGRFAAVPHTVAPHPAGTNG